MFTFVVAFQRPTPFLQESSTLATVAAIILSLTITYHLIQWYTGRTKASRTTTNYIAPSTMDFVEIQERIRVGHYEVLFVQNVVTGDMYAPYKKDLKVACQKIVGEITDNQIEHLFVSAIRITESDWSGTSPIYPGRLFAMTTHIERLVVQVAAFNDAKISLKDQPLPKKDKP